MTAPQPTPQPVAAPLPTPQPVTVGGGGDCSSASCITVTIVEGSEWWFRAKVSGVPNGVTIEKVEVRNSNSNWETGVFQGWCSTASVGCYVFGSFQAAVTPPLDFQITATSGQVLTALDLVSSFDAGSAGTMTESFDAGSSAYETADEDAEDGEGTAWTVWLALSLCALVVLAVAIALVVCLRRKRARVVQYFDDDKDAAADTKGTEVDARSTAGSVQMEEAGQPMTSATV